MTAVEPEEDVMELFRRYRATRDRALRNRLVQEHEHLVEPHLRRFLGKGHARDDLRQVAFLAVIGAVERFDPDRGVAFAAFAGSTIRGELKRFVRDQTWNVRPPRRLQEVYLDVVETDRRLTQSNGRSATVEEIAGEVGVSEDEVIEALAAGNGRRGSAISDALSGSLAMAVADSYAGAELRLCLSRMLRHLDEREREIFERAADQSQSAIAAHLGVSQAYVSRVLGRVHRKVSLALAG